MRPWLSRLRFAGALLSALLLLPLGVGAQAAGIEFTFPFPVDLGRFDLDLAVDDLQPGSTSKTWGTYSHVVQGTNLIKIFNRLGRTTDGAPRAVNTAKVLNANTVATDQGPGALGSITWNHEVSTVAWNPNTKKWVYFWSSYPSDDTGGDGTRLFQYQWIGMKTMDNLGSSYPNPSFSTLSAKETRLFVGLGYNNANQSGADAWATGAPVYPPGLPGDRLYATFTEPGAINVNGTLYLAITGHGTCQASPPPATYCGADILLFSSPDDGATWTYVNRVVETADAQALSPSFTGMTASSLYKTAGGQIRLITSPGTAGGTYVGLFEYEFTNIATGSLIEDGAGHPIVQWNLISDDFGNIFGAGSFHPATGNRQYSKHYSTGTRFRVLENQP